MKGIHYQILTVCLILFFVPAAQAAPISAVELLENSEPYDQKTITFKGEAIGSVMARGDFAWVNLHDGAGALGVFLPSVLGEKIKRTGGYDFSGDIVLARGEFNRFCADHGGDTDIHATALEIIKPGQKQEHPLESKKIIAAIILLAAGLCLAIIHLIVCRFR